MLICKVDSEYIELLNICKEILEEYVLYGINGLKEVGVICLVLLLLFFVLIGFVVMLFWFIIVVVILIGWVCWNMFCLLFEKDLWEVYCLSGILKCWGLFGELN